MSNINTVNNYIFRQRFSWRTLIMNFDVIMICIVASCVTTVSAQKTGELCLLQNGVTGVCKPLDQCNVAVAKATQGEAPAICSFESNSLVVCCVEGAKVQPQSLNGYSYSILPEQGYNARITDYENQYFGYPPVHVIHTRAERPWWLAGNTFVRPAASNPAPRGPQVVFEKPTGSNSENWWMTQEHPFGQPSQSKPEVLPPTIPPEKPHRPSQSIRESESTNTLRTSERKCKQYSNLAVEHILAVPLIPNPDPISIDVPKCDFRSLELIVGGEKTKPKEFPHMAALGYKNGGNIEWRCGGSLISDYYVLTAAHCCPKKHPPIMARLGELNLRQNDDGAEPENYMVAEVIRHPDYKPPAKYNDIALLRLDQQVTFNDFIRPACLYTSDHFEVDKTIATGWGKIDFAENPSDILLKVAIDIIDNKVCNDLYELDGVTRELSRGIAPSMMCAGKLEGGKDTCQGDSGGPIQITRANNRCVYSIIGITSFGKFCAAKNAPGVYTRVSSFIPWIESIVWPEEE